MMQIWLSCLVLGGMIVLCGQMAVAAESAFGPRLPAENGSVKIPAQSTEEEKGRDIAVYLVYPQGKLANVDKKTGLFLALHNWGGTGASGAPDPQTLADRYNVIAISVEYYQSKQDNSDRPYDFGWLQALDALRALYYVKANLTAAGIKYAEKRVYCTGGSGGGNVTQMANKLAPRAFACIVDISGMASLTDDIAYNLPGGSSLNARFSKEENDANYLYPDAQELRDLGNEEQLKQIKKQKPSAKIVVIHGEGDNACLCDDKKRVVAAMEKSGLEVEAHFISKKDVDGKLILDSGHSLGDRTQLLMKYADKYLLPDSKEMRQTHGKSEFEKRGEVKYRTSGGAYLVDYTNGYPEGAFKAKK
jgi:predicted esterase